MRLDLVASAREVTPQIIEVTLTTGEVFFVPKSDPDAELFEINRDYVSLNANSNIVVTPIDDDPNAGHVITQTDLIYCGDRNWRMVAGTEFKIKKRCRMVGLTFYTGNGTDGVTSHYDVIKSTETGARPTLDTYTDSIATGTMTAQIEKGWNTVSDPFDHIFEVGEWVIARLVVRGGAAYGRKNDMRAAGELDEEFAKVMGSVYTASQTPLPGPAHPIAPPSTRNTGLAIGIPSLRLKEV